MSTESPRSVLELFRIEPGGQDLRWVGPVHQCPLCEFDLFHILAKFEDGVVVFYFTDAVCTRCGSTIKAPTPLDLL